MADFQIRLATSDDVNVLTQRRIEFLTETANEYSTHPIPVEKLSATISNYFSQKVPTGEFMAWLAEKDGEIIGTSGLVFFDSLPSPDNLSGRNAYILNMFTLSEHRQQGVASTIIETILEYLKTTTASRVFLHTTSKGSTIYEKFGFVSRHEEMELHI